LKIEIEVEYQQKLLVNDLGFNGKDFTLLNKQTACLAEDGIPQEKKQII
jgi:hypothetical protein